MALRDKIAQMIMIGFDSHRLQEDTKIFGEIQAGHIGGVILFDYDCITETPGKNILSPSQLKLLTQDLQQCAHDAKLPPLFIAIDYEGGKVNRLKEQHGFIATHSAKAVATLPLPEATAYFNEMAKQLKTFGINLNFAPCIDMAVNPNNPVIVDKDRSFSDDPEVVIKYASCMAEAFEQYGILYAPKHFPGHGSSSTDTHHGFVDITSTWDPIELSPFQALINSKHPPPMLMTAHLINEQLDPSGFPATLSRPILTDLLREKLHFQGLIISDDMQMRAISDTYTMPQAVLQAINAGVDILLIGNQLAAAPHHAADLVDIIEDAVMAGKLTQTRIEASYQRIIQIKQKLI